MHALAPLHYAGTFDVRNISLDRPVDEGHVCFKITYVRGHELPAKTFILLKTNETGSNTLNYTIIEELDCISDVPPNGVYTSYLMCGLNI